MKLNEIKKIEAIKEDALANIKGGGRDTRNDQPIGGSPYTVIVKKP